MGYDLLPEEIPGLASVTDETKLAMAVYARRGLPQTPDCALSPNARGAIDAAHWYERLTPSELERLRQAIRSA